MELVKSPSGLRVMDFGCSNWRNSAYLESLGAHAVRIDAVAYTRPDVVAYPTHLPFRDRAFDAALFTHIFMFLEDKAHWPAAAAELRRVSRRYVVVETYAVKNPAALRYDPAEVERLFGRSARRGREAGPTGLPLRPRHVRTAVGRGPHPVGPRSFLMPTSSFRALAAVASFLLPSARSSNTWAAIEKSPASI